MAEVAESQRILTQSETDQQMLVWLRDQLSHFKEGGNGRRYSDSIVSRFGELIESQTTFKRCLDAVTDAQKLAMHQMQFAQSALKQVERTMMIADHFEKIGNGKTHAAIDLKGE